MNQKSNFVIYLAGGFRSGWQLKVTSILVGHQLFDPSLHGLESPNDYTAWDLDAIRRSDIVLAYMEKDNPGGFSLALEVGYAKALGKTVYLVEEHPTEQRRRYFEMVRQVADMTFPTLDTAIGYLKQLEAVGSDCG